VIQIVIRVRSGAASFRVTVRAQSIERAFGLVRGSYPGANASLVLPVEPESFFAGDDLEGAEMVTPQRRSGKRDERAPASASAADRDVGERTQEEVRDWGAVVAGHASEDLPPADWPRGRPRLAW
jgi:hypothetical protein